MATKELKLSIEHRDRLGTTGSNALRAAGKIPAVVYGHGNAPDHIALDAHAFGELLHRSGRNAIITLVGDGKKQQTAMVRVVQIHPVSRRIVHADLQRVSADETIGAKLGIVTVGVAEGVKQQGAVMDVVVHEVEIEGPADRIPERLEVDVTPLTLHQHLTAGEIPLPEGIKLLTPPDTVVITIELSRTATELEEAATPSEEVQPEVIGAETPAAES
ncbi:MAG TPA: 50S ribosomal protein L25 [Candidatus Cybelea sp.]|nr:50S ribosomal protein L25 [Candidatus Cybelea sp.]